jgi:hypothetical protein
VWHESFELPFPELLPDCPDALSRPARELLRGESVLACVARPEMLPVAAGGPARGHEPASSRADEKFREHDRFFGVRRVADNPGYAFLRGLVVAHARAYQNAIEMESTLLTDCEWLRLFAGLERVFACASYRPDDGRSAIALPVWDEECGEGYDPKRRWLVGHQLYFVLIQGVIVGLRCFASARKAGRRPEAADSLRVATTLMYGSATAVKYTSDFGPVDYELAVRPMMAPPAVGKGFSGLQTRDHALLVQQFRQLRPLLADSEDLAGLREEFLDSVVAAYAAHEFICARFGGNILPSLRMAATTNGSTTRSGVEVIRQMMRGPAGPDRRGRATSPGAGHPMSKATRVDGLRIAYDDIGRGEPVFLLLPGWVSDRSVHAPLAARLGEHRRVLLLDWRGHGESEPPRRDFRRRDRPAVVHEVG